MCKRKIQISKSIEILSKLCLLTLSRCFSGLFMKVKVKLTTNNLGTFRFHVCPLNQTNSVETEECFNKYPIILSNGSYEYQVPEFQTTFNIEVQLPYVYFEHCAFRWTYETAKDLNGHRRMFRNCADIMIVQNTLFYKFKKFPLLRLRLDPDDLENQRTIVFPYFCSTSTAIIRLLPT